MLQNIYQSFSHMLHFLYNKFFGFCSHHVAFSTKVSGSLLVITLVISHYIRYILYIRISCFLVITLHLLYYKFLLFHCHNVALSIHIIPYFFSIITQLICYFSIHHTLSSTQISYSFPIIIVHPL